MMSGEHADPAGGPSPEADLPWGALTTDLAGRIATANARFADWCGRPAEALVGQAFSGLLAPASRILHETHLVPLLEVQGFAYEVALDLLAPDRRRTPILVSAVRRDGEVRITAFDATEIRRHERDLVAARREAEAAAQALGRANVDLRERSELLSLTLGAITDAVVTTDPAGHIVAVNPAAERLLQQDHDALVGQRLQDMAALEVHGRWLPVSPDLARQPAGAQAGAAAPLQLRRADGSTCWVSASVAPMQDAAGQTAGAVWVARDVTQAHLEAERRAFESTHDPLTGLLNRNGLEVQLRAGVSGHAPVPGMLCHLDMDQFKVVNDTLGMGAGDQLLVQVAEALRAALGPGAALARLSADEFAYLLPGASGDEALQRSQAVCARIALLALPWQGRTYRLTASIGIAAAPDSADGVARALAAAHVATAAAKAAGGNRAKLFGEQHPEVGLRWDEMAWVGRIQQALSEERFVLYLQPIVETGAPGVPHGEILLRLEEDGRLLGPGAFIPAAERFRQMQAIDRYVVRKALAWLQTHDAAEVSVNVSGQSFGDPAFCDHVVAALAETGVDAARICFELTETAAVDDLPSALAFMRALKARGARFALDDFGAGLSSFAYLRQLPVDVVKIDGSFVRTLTTDGVNRAIVESIHRVARLCGMKTTAEWVEDTATLECLRDIGVDHAQGYGVGRPAPLSAWQPVALGR